MQKSLIIILSLIFLSSLVALGVVELKKQSDAKVVQNQTPAPEPTETPAPVINEKFAEAVSPDGKKTLAMVATKDQLGDKYTLTLLTEKSDEPEVVYQELFSSGAVVELPFNAFSPEGKYIFLKQTNQNGTTYLTIPISKGFETGVRPVTNVSEIFYSKYSDYVITDVTGWGGVSLLVVNTNKVQGDKGPSFWFEASTGRFYKLTTRFN